MTRADSCWPSGLSPRGDQQLARPGRLCGSTPVCTPSDTGAWRPIARAAAAGPGLRARRGAQPRLGRRAVGASRRWPRHARGESAPGRRRRLTGIAPPRTTTLTRADRHRQRGVRVTSPARTLADIRPRLTARQFARPGQRRAAGGRPASAPTRPPLSRPTRTTPARPARSSRTRSSAELQRPGFPEPMINASRARPRGRPPVPRAEADRRARRLERSTPITTTLERDRSATRMTTAAGYVTLRIT